MCDNHRHMLGKNFDEADRRDVERLMLKAKHPACGISFLLTLLLFVFQVANLWQELTVGRAASAGQERGLKKCD